MRVSRHFIGMGLALSIWPLSGLHAAGQASGTPAGGPGMATVTINARRAVADSRTVIAAKSRVMSRNRASSCAFMSSYSAADDDVTLAYMNEFGQAGGISDPSEHFNENSPGGDASDAADSTGVEDPMAGAVDPNAPSVGCGPADRKFAAGRNHIERNDKSLGEAFVAFDAKDYARARSLFKTAYDKVGYDEAALMLAKMHLYGLGTPKNTGQAISWLRKVAEARFDPGRDRLQFDPKAPEHINERTEASILLAKIYLVGMGVGKDPAQARKWYEHAADGGFVPALDTLGLASLSGYGGPKDARKAFGYFKEAADAGYGPAQYNLATLYHRGADGVAQDLKLAAAYFAAAAKTGHAGALYAAGRMFDLGEGIPADQHRAIVYYKEAALKGHASAQYALGTYFYAGLQVARNYETARKLFSAAAMQQQVDGMFNLAVMLDRGEGGPKDQAMAYVWFSLAKAAGYQSADAALKEVAAQLTPDERAKAEAILRPAK